MKAFLENCYGNVLRVKLENAQNGISPEYIINHSASFQARATNLQIFIKFAKLHHEDPLNYIIKLTCDELMIKNKPFNEYEEWHPLKINRGLLFKIELIVYLEILPGTNFEPLYADTELTDFELRGVDGSVQIHKALLAVSSPVFRKMVSGKWQEAKEGHVIMKDTSKITLQYLKDYLYLNILPDTGFEQLLLLASYYMMPGLEQKCVDKLVVNMTTDNIGELLKFATQHEIPRLWLSILSSYANGVVNDKAIWKKLVIDNLKLD